MPWPPVGHNIPLARPSPYRSLSLSFSLSLSPLPSPLRAPLQGEAISLPGSVWSSLSL